MVKMKKINKTPVEIKASKPQVLVRRRRKSGGDEGSVFLLIFITFGVLAAISPAACGVIFLGVVPTLVQIYADTSALKYFRIQSVGMINCAAVLPFAMQVYENPSELMSVITNPLAYTAMWGAAAIAHVVLLTGPIIAALILQSFAQDKLKNIAQQRKELIEIWGSDILPNSSDTPVQKDNFIKPHKN